MMDTKLTTRQKRLIWLQIILAAILFVIVLYFSQRPPKTGYMYEVYGRKIQNQIRPAGNK